MKRIETRHWTTKYRGPLAIHCAKTKDHASFIHDPRVLVAFQQEGIFLRTHLNYGHVVATCNLVDVLPTESLLKSGLYGPVEIALGNYAPGRFGWLLDDLRVLTAPLPWKGGQGFFDVPDQMLNSDLSREGGK